MLDRSRYWFVNTPVLEARKRAAESEMRELYARAESRRLEVERLEQEIQRRNPKVLKAHSMGVFRG